MVVAGMAYLFTQWGYEVEVGDGSSVPAIIAPADIESASKGQIKASDPRVASMCLAVSSAIRDYCGWHIAPVLTCRYATELTDRIMYLPAVGVRGIKSVSIDGKNIPVDTIEYKTSGLVRLSNLASREGSKWGSAVVEYEAGFANAEALVSQIAAQIALNALTATAGVRSESAGQVSLTYNTTGDGITGGVSLLSRDASLLAPYRLSRLR